MPADLRADIDLALNVPLVVHLQNPFLIPPTQIKVLAVEAQIGASQLWTGKQFLKAVSRRVAIDMAVVIQPFADREPPAVIRSYSRPHDSGRIDFLDNLQSVGFGPVEGAEITRTHPKLLPVPRQRLRRHGR